MPSTADEASSSSPLPAPVHRPPVSGYPVGAGFPAACELDDPELRPERPWLDHRRPLDTADPASQSVCPDDRVDRPRPRPAQSREALGVGDVAPGAYTPAHPVVDQRHHPLRARGPKLPGVPDDQPGEVGVERRGGGVGFRMGAGQPDEAHVARLDGYHGRRRQTGLRAVGAQERVARLGRLRAQVLNAPVELVVADGAHVYAEVCGRLEAARSARKDRERPRRREVTRVRPHGGPLLSKPVERPCESFAARQGAVGRRRGQVRAAEVVGDDDPYWRNLAHQFPSPDFVGYDASVRERPMIPHAGLRRRCTRTVYKGSSSPYVGESPSGVSWWRRQRT